MNAPKIHTREFRPRYYEMDGRGELTPVALLNCLEESAFSHCEESGWDVFRLMKAGFGWMLLRGGLRMERYPRYRSVFTVETWLSASRLFYGTREYRIRDAEGALLGFARSLWLFCSLERKRPVRVFDEILRSWSPEGTEAGALALDEITTAPPNPEGAAAPRFEVRRSEIDTNGHANNVNYLAWALEAADSDLSATRYLSSIRGQYKREVTLGSVVRPVFSRGDGDGEYGLAVYADGPQGTYLAAAAESTWFVRPAGEVA